MRKLFNSEARLTQGFGARPSYYSQFGLKGHEGADYIPTSGDWSVLCLEDGIVVKDDDIAGDKRTDAYGINVTIWHPKIKKATQYCHLANNIISLNQQVKAGEKIGVMGTTGNTDGAHVHLNLFDVDDNGVRLNRDNGYLGGTDPVPFINSAIITQEITQQPQITDQTRIPQLGNMEVQQIRSKLSDMERDIKQLVIDVAEYKKQLKDCEEVEVTTTTYTVPASEAPEPPKTAETPKTDQSIVDFFKWLFGR